METGCRACLLEESCNVQGCILPMVKTVLVICKNSSSTINELGKFFHLMQADVEFIYPVSYKYDCFLNLVFDGISFFV